MIKNIIFDMGGVLIDFNPEKTLHSLFDDETAEIALKDIFRNRLWAEKDRGTVTPDEIMQTATGRIPEKHLAKISELCHNLYPYMKPFPEMEKFIKVLKEKGYGIYLLSNASDDWYLNRYYIPALRLFDGYIISADWKLVKPEKEIYEKLFEVYNLKPSECIFIDDVPANAEGAEKAGMQAYCYADGDIGRLKSEFRKMGIL